MGKGSTEHRANVRAIGALAGRLVEAEVRIVKLEAALAERAPEPAPASVPEISEEAQALVVSEATVPEEVVPEPETKTKERKSGTPKKPKR